MPVGGRAIARHLGVDLRAARLRVLVFLENDDARAATLAAIADLRADFPGMVTHDGKPWHYLDTAATAQKPRAVIEAITRGYARDYATVHRGVYARSAHMTEAYEAAREAAARFINGRADETIFVRGATEAINLVANSWGNANIGPGDRILLTELEHHANIVPWRMLADRAGAEALGEAAEGVVDTGVVLDGGHRAVHLHDPLT